MSSRDPRWDAFAEVLRETGVLLAVFPLLDQLVAPGPFRWAIVGPSLGLALTLIVLGVSLHRGGHG